MSLSKSRFVRSKKKSRKKNRNRIKNHTEIKNGGGPYWDPLATAKEKAILDPYKDKGLFLDKIQYSDDIHTNTTWYKRAINKNKCGTPTASPSPNCLTDEDAVELETKLDRRSTELEKAHKKTLDRSLLDKEPAYKDYKSFLKMIQNIEMEYLEDEEVDDLKGLYERAIEAYTCDDDETENCLKVEEAEELNRFLDDWILGS